MWQVALEPFLWALHDSPTASTTERLILTGLAEKADADGCNAFPSKKTLARIALCDQKTVQRKLGELRQRGVIAYGDQEAARYIPAHVRPKVYELMIPAAWYGPEQLTRVNKDREHRGLPPLTPENRPRLAPAPPKTARSDKGKRRPKKGGDSQSPLPENQGGDSQSPGRGDSQSPEGGLSVPQPSPVTPPTTENPPSVRPSVRTPEVNACKAQTDGGTDGRGGGAIEEEQAPAAVGGGDGATAAPGTEAGCKTGPTRPAIPASEGAAVLLEVGRRVPNLAVSGKVLLDQGLRLDGLLAAGYRPEQLVAALAVPVGHIRVSAGAVISGRISALPTTAVRLPEQPTHSGFHDDGQEHDGRGRADDKPLREAVAPPKVRAECEGCGRPGVVTGSDLCPVCLGWPECSAGCGIPGRIGSTRRADPNGSGMCSVCESAANPDPVTDDDAFAVLVAEAARRAKGAEQAPR
jgi:Helix-turn-helix domain